MSQGLVVLDPTVLNRGALPKAPLRVRVFQRLPKLDALRGAYACVDDAGTSADSSPSHHDQQLGFVSEAEEFVFLSAFLTGRIFGRVASESGFETVIRRLWKRALRLYGYHLFLLA